MKQNTTRFPVEMMSRALGVSRSGYYKWLKFSCTKTREIELNEEIKAAFERSNRRYGSPRCGWH